MKKLLALLSLVPFLASAQPAIEQNTNFNAYWTTNGSNMVLYVVGLTNENVNWQAKGVVFSQLAATNAAAAGCATAQSSSTGTSVGNKPVGQFSDSDWVASEFTPTNSYTLCTVKLRLYAVGSPSGNLKAYIYAESAGLPTTLVGTGSDTVAASSVPSTNTVVTFSNMSASLTSSTKYFVVLENSVVNSSNYIGWDAVSLSGNTAKSGDGSTWADYASDRTLYFEAFSN